MGLLNNGSLAFVDRVKVPGQDWSIGVPEGFEYSTDPKVNGKSSSNPSGVYDLILAKPKSKRDVDFDSPYSNAISFVTLEYSSFRAFEMDLNIKKDEYEAILLTDDLSVILIPMMSTGGVNSYFIYVNSEEQIRRCQLLISGPYKKEEKMEFARQLAKSISI